jgi:heparan sulfate 6-O-sulfotransferase HS6ST1
MKLENRAKPSTTKFCCVSGLTVILFFVGTGLLFSYFFTDFNNVGDTEYSSISFTAKYSLDEMRSFAYKNGLSKNYKPSLYLKWNLSFNRIFEDSENRFDINSNDVIVFLHIQKTAGTSFEKFLVKYLNISRPCVCNVGKKRCTCLRPNSRKESWLFSRYSTGWACGLHADYTELSASGCVDRVLDKKEGKHQKRRYFYTSFLREPITRFISEYRHVERGATWLASRHVCNGKPPTPEQLPMCFDPEVGWDGVLMEEFLSCPYNLAFNRQTRMLADLTLINCYDTSTMNSTMRDKIMLESAKNNLRNLAFFGIKEKMEESQLIFEKTFQMTFTRELAEWNKSKSHDTPLTETEMKVIREKNHLDIQLYEFAVKLFNKRLELIKSNSESKELRPKPIVYFKSEDIESEDEEDTGSSEYTDSTFMHDLMNSNETDSQ